MPEAQLYKSRGFRSYLILEAIICFLIVVLLFVTQPTSWLLAGLCAFVAASPDLVSFGRFQKIRHGETYKPNLYTRFASRIQWFEKPIGAVVEVFYLGAAALVLANLLHIW